ncbi:Alpha/beta hydrolase family protein [Grimontia celer]|uniref:Alpha/beta hydrolase family protein n=1 Tax=Grimontia celer TaxID=1796497 RepID=A0A128F357_9GAMM|nr:prolyl oligopeptidase family serine peptidase [Grimontia celer]CZF81238.1 Alpha/beta hydrolase family protein [Grimontia celer]
MELKIDKRRTIVDIHENGVRAHPCLVVAIHGDSPFGAVSYQNQFAKAIAKRASNVVSVGLLRPGFKDDLGRKSGSWKGFCVGDNYNRKRIDHIVSAIQTLKDLYSPSKIIICGHSGGAAITGKIIAYYPSLADIAVMVSCPADINRWRKDMYEQHRNPLFWGNLRVTSPMALVDRIDAKTGIHLICGKEDDVTQPYLTEDYAKALNQNGKKVQTDVIPGGHDIFLDEFVIDKVVVKVNSMLSQSKNAQAIEADCQA